MEELMRHNLCQKTFKCEDGEEERNDKIEVDTQERNREDPREYYTCFSCYSCLDGCIITAGMYSTVHGGVNDSSFVRALDG